MIRRIHASILTAALIGLSATAVAAPTPVGDDDDDDDMSFDPVDINKPQDEGAPEIEMDEPEIEMDEPDVEPDLSADLSANEDAVDTNEEIVLLDNRVSWQDIVVVVRKSFLKLHRFEASPLFGVTMNDNIVQHVAGGAQINYWLTDALAVGVEGFGYVKNLREPFDLVARQARRLPTVNRYNFSAALNFHYVPAYGKFAVLDRNIVHWEVFLTAGVGMTQSEVIPRDPRMREFTNFLITPNVGASMRFFITRFLTVNIGLRDYIFVDNFENTNRMLEQTVEQAKADASSSLINNVMFQAGVALWIPLGFDYTTFR
jgi:outer membrane beta-barrel protein